MLRYDLDKLGWFDFEGLCQSLLKVRLAIGVEAWGGSGDWGHDAFFQGPLKFPGDEIRPGPFVFQCKFVDSANAAGASPQAALFSAIGKECNRIASRLSSSADGRKATWSVAPQVYALMTNVDLSGADRERAAHAIHAVLPGATVSTFGASDLCALLDSSPDLVRAFPQLLSIRDLDQLLSALINRDVLQRSKAALDEAKDIAAVFVPTSTYSDALSVLHDHNFVILEGPPEMGKTAIGRMAALNLVFRGWDAIECQIPQDVLKTIDDAQKQVFIADDFFGRGEYTPEAVSAWQAELPHILRRLNGHHRLILTTRIHLWNMAKADLDLSGRASRQFPGLAEVVVDVSRLTPLEKAHMLYRHLKASPLDASARILLRPHASAITQDVAFTPERIRRLAMEVLPAISQAGQLSERRLGEVIAESLRDPTKGMRVSFRKLRPAHKWLLVAFLETERTFSLTGTAAETLAEAYKRLCPPADQEPFRDTFAAMSQAFVRASKEGGLRWVHPSCRDLTIDQIVSDHRIRLRFLEHMELDGVRLATSVGGGAAGGTTMPLLTSPEDWRAFESRCLELLRRHRTQLLLAVWDNYVELVRPERARDDRIGILANFLGKRLWPAAIELLNHNLDWTFTTLKAYYGARGMIGDGGSLPRVSEVWAEEVDEIEKVLTQESVAAYAMGADVDRFADLAKLLSEHASGVIPTFVRDLERVITLICFQDQEDTLTTYEFDGATRSELEQAADGYAAFAAGCETLKGIGLLSEGIVDVVGSADAHFDERSQLVHPGEPDYDPDDRLFDREADMREFGLLDLFQDL